jgi:hypothetical protein
VPRPLRDHTSSGTPDEGGLRFVVRVPSCGSPPTGRVGSEIRNPMSDIRYSKSEIPRPLQDVVYCLFRDSKARRDLFNSKIANCVFQMQMLHFLGRQIESGPALSRDILTYACHIDVHYYIRHVDKHVDKKSIKWLYNEWQMPSRKEKIERRLKQLGQNPNWLARQIGKPKQSVYQWIDGAKPRDPDATWRAVANALGIADHRVLMDDTLDLPAQPDEVRTVRSEDLPDRVKAFLRGDRAVLPVWHTVLAGGTDECAFVDPDSVQWEEVPALFVGQDVDRYVLCVASGTSMSPRIRQGDKVVIRLDPAPPRNTLVIAESPDRRRYVKALRENQHLELHSLNDKFKPIEDTTDWTLIGSVVCVMSLYEGTANIEWDYGKPLRV